MYVKIVQIGPLMYQISQAFGSMELPVLLLGSFSLLVVVVTLITLPAIEAAMVSIGHQSANTT